MGRFLRLWKEQKVKNSSQHIHEYPAMDDLILGCIWLCSCDEIFELVHQGYRLVWCPMSDNAKEYWKTRVCNVST